MTVNFKIIKQKRPKNFLLFQCMKQNETNLGHFGQQSYTCNCCDYNTSKKNHFERHILTDKHSKRVNETKVKQKGAERAECICGKIFGSRTTLWRHKKVCGNFIINTNVENEKLNISDDNLILMLINQCKELRDENKGLIEIIKNGTHHTINSNNTISNKTFNLNLFLNETCKDAMNITDFVESIKLQLSDLEKVGEIGYVEGISNIINTNLKALDVTQRPIHCTDKKREVLYIKDEDKWVKEDNEKRKLRKAIKKIADKNSRLLLKYKEKYPDCNKSNSKYADQYNKIIVEAFGGQGDDDVDKENKIIAKIAKDVVIDK